MSERPDAPSVISLLVSLLSISLMSVLFGRKTSGTSMANINYARGLVISLYVVSWLFTTIAAVLTSTNTGNIMSCTLSIFVCLSLYAASKIIIYLFLIEKVYVVSSVTTTRKDTMLYRFNILLLTPYTVILVLMILNHVAVLDENDQCFIGLKPLASIVLILYDIFISCWLTVLFIRPLMSSTSVLQGPSKGKLRQVARRTLIGSVIALILSSGNVFTLVYYRGYEDSVLCLLSCTLDVTLNACTVHWVTSRGSRNNTTTDKASRGITNQNTNQINGTLTEKQVAPTDTHISVTVESYMEH
ncbi:hypothetical protein BKA57DRAFT_532466 [Linnemannia elongata]|uniref:G-protein coupled receptors family 2 profile 2 domain-containing protein n=1 Tax=Linnemannia elongata AG-77 TaxID=1314771 RepID=A0A197JV09_9FUNG|nr:hypothetical protein BGZ91_008828 [Linnemannia elongata]KAG0062372.1 hypothetical protein BGZ89_010703 [Linnemannia elongata]KAG0075133.1 hypothetical protein BGZ90_010172 [Linnemannia elongata]KAH7056873.1 hypothetical protein BKA57DRAFT_532466 [Linnemannia elongata]OAQ28276.1 hypothetical protein K457DRAFT_20459 [Linnemannia elongata AG-77]